MAKKTELFFPTDPPEWHSEIRALQKRGYKVTRPSPHQIKVGPINYYPSTGTITSDPCRRHTEKGFDGLLEVLDHVISISTGKG